MTTPVRTRQLSAVGGTILLGVIAVLGWSTACSYEASLGSALEPVSVDARVDAAIDADIDAPPVDADVDAPPDAAFDATFAPTAGAGIGPFAIDASLDPGGPGVVIDLGEVDAGLDPPGAPAATTR